MGGILLINIPIAFFPSWLNQLFVKSLLSHICVFARFPPIFLAIGIKGVFCVLYSEREIKGRSSYADEMMSLPLSALIS